MDFYKECDALTKNNQIEKAIKEIEEKFGVDIKWQIKTPHLRGMFRDKDFGVIGTPTKFKEQNDEPLCIGDIVSIHSKELGIVLGEAFVVHTEENGDFIMGIQDGCDGETGEIDERWIITKELSYKNVSIGTTRLVVTAKEY